MGLVIGLAGGTGAGKSAIVRGVIERLGGCAIDLDAYYLDRSGLSVDERARLNYDEPGAIDVSLLVQHLRCLVAGRPVQKPTYCFETHTRIGMVPVAPARVLLVEGLFTLWWPELRALLSLKVFVQASADLRLTRRLRRDVVERGRSTDQVLHQYVNTVRPMHERYVEPGRAHADLVVTNEGPIEDGVTQVVAAVAAIERRRAVYGRADAQV